MNETNNVLWAKEGPRLEMTRQAHQGPYSHVLHISDLNPEVRLKWCLSRWEMIRIGWWFIRRALFARVAK